MRLSPTRLLLPVALALSLLSACGGGATGDTGGGGSTSSGGASSSSGSGSSSSGGSSGSGSSGGTSSSSSSSGGTSSSSSGGTGAADGHPRLWITAADLPRLRGLAAASNPYWQDGLAQTAVRAKADMDAGRVPNEDCGDIGYEEYPTEMYAALFAFLAQMAPEAERAGYAQRARTLLMHVIREADKGPAPSANFSCNGNTQYPRFRHPDFATEDRDRARYHGEAFALTVDWIYGALSADDKAAIRRVFLRWSEEIVTRGYHHPEPVGLQRDPALYADKYQRRFAGNNYYAAHMRNLGLMALAFDAADDTDGRLRGYLDSATGAYLYIFDQLLRSDARGGLLPEGFEYSPQTAGYAAQFLLALKTAGYSGSEADQLRDTPFWSQFIPAYLHSLSPATVVREADRGAEYEPAFYGDAQEYALPDFINSLGPIGVYDLATGGNPARLAAARWAAIHTPAGGAARLGARIANPEDYRNAILYFLLLDPAVTPADPRPTMATHHFAPGPNRLFARSGWGSGASWFSWNLAWNSIDHQNAEGNGFAYYRGGEWLTKTRVGYADIGESIASTEYANGLCIQNDRPDRDEADWRNDLWKRGSQWYLVSDDDPALLAQSVGADYAYALGDATRLYNSESENSRDVRHASRSILWLSPDLIVVYDRAESASAGRFKRWWLQLPRAATISGSRALMTTVKGQQLAVTSLLPAGAVLANVASDAHDPEIDRKVARNEPMQARLSVTAAGNPASARFLHVLQGADAGAALLAPTLIASTDSLWQGARLGTTLVLMPRDLPAGTSLEIELPAGATRLLVTGLAANTAYLASRNGSRLRFAPGSPGTASDAGGVLDLRL